MGTFSYRVSNANCRDLEDGFSHISEIWTARKLEKNMQSMNSIFNRTPFHA